MENVYPKWLYHAESDPILVNDQAQHEAVGASWAESPDEAKAAAQVAAQAAKATKPAARREAKKGE